MAQEARGKKKTRTGVVISDKMDKTITVRVSGLVKHRAFKKYIMRSVKYKVHDELNECREGDTVLIEETRPLSKDKHWKVKEILERAA
jgi:small subunit ribosomal protein S17